MTNKKQSFLTIAQNKKTLKCEKFLEEMEQVIPWDNLLEEIKPYYPINGAGRNKTELLLLLKIYFLQQWYNLSDPGAEEAIYDRNSFQKFLDIDLISSNIPDETTILNFRHLLEQNKLPEKFLETVNRILEQKGYIMREGTIVDASIIKAPSSTKNQEKKRDPEMSSTKKGSNYYFGMKMHIGVDNQKGLVHTLKTTTAKNHDRDKFYNLLHGDEKIILGDKGYYNEKDKTYFRSQDIFFGILDKAKRNQKLSDKQKKRNKKLASIRAKVEIPFRVIKCQFNYTKTRYRGLFKNTMQLNTLFMLTNIYLIRKQLLA